MRIPRSCRSNITTTAAAAYSIVAGGFTNTLSILNFDGKDLSVTGSLDMPKGPSWVEPNADYSAFYTVTDEKVITVCKLDGKGGAEITSKVTVDQEGSTHVHYSKDGLTVANYGSGSITFIPFGGDEHTLAEGKIKNHAVEYRYEGKTPPSEGKGQDKARCHGSITAEDGTHYFTDLGSDYIYAFTLSDSGDIEIGTRYDLPEGFGPRHIASPDGKNLYVVGEVSNEVIAVKPGVTEVKDGVSILPPDLPEGYGTLMGAGEIVSHPTVPTTLYASNPNQLSIVDKHPDYKAPEGDFVAVLQVTTPGEPAKVVKHIPTKCNHIRAMKTSPDGEYVAVAGLNNAKIEVYKISGEAKDEWTLVATHDGIEQVSDITFFPKKN